MNKELFTREDILAYEERCGVNAAVKYFLLIGPDSFDGDYDAMLKELEEDLRMMTSYDDNNTDTVDA